MEKFKNLRLGSVLILLSLAGGALSSLFLNGGDEFAPLGGGVLGGIFGLLGSLGVLLLIEGRPAPFLLIPKKWWLASLFLLGFCIYVMVLGMLRDSFVL